MTLPQKESPTVAGPGGVSVDAANTQSIYADQASKARAAKPVPVVLVMTKATPDGGVVTVPGRIGTERFGEVGQLLLEYVKLHYARQAAAMGHQIAFITQSDGKEADWSLNIDRLEAWEASFRQGGA
jgi:hypothetical protein